MIIQILAVIGIILSAYALYVSMKKDPKYKPFCDLSKTVSCSKAFASKYNNLLILPNAFVGILFYITVLYTSTINGPYLVTLSLLGAIATVILAYLSYYKLRTFCLVCTLVYLVNVAITLLAFKDAFLP